MGYPDELFAVGGRTKDKDGSLNKPSAHLNCAICHEVFRDATMLRCGHTYCKACIVRTLEPRSSLSTATPGNCPICREPATVDSLSPNLITQQIILDLPVRCMQEDGSHPYGRKLYCGWKGNLGDWFKVHCPKECPYQMMECTVPGCTVASLSRQRHLPSHLTEEMGNKPLQYLRCQRDGHFKTHHLALFIREQNDKHCAASPPMLQVENARTTVVNGTYFLDGFNAKGTAIYKKQSLWNGIATCVVIGKYVDTIPNTNTAESSSTVETKNESDVLGRGVQTDRIMDDVKIPAVPTNPQAATVATTTLHPIRPHNGGHPMAASRGVPVSFSAVTGARAIPITRMPPPQQQLQLQQQLNHAPQQQHHFYQSHQYPHQVAHQQQQQQHGHFQQQHSVPAMNLQVAAAAVPQDAHFSQQQPQQHPARSLNHSNQPYTSLQQQFRQEQQQKSLHRVNLTGPSPSQNSTHFVDMSASASSAPFRSGGPLITNGTTQGSTRGDSLPMTMPGPRVTYTANPQASMTNGNLHFAQQSQPDQQLRLLQQQHHQHSIPRQQQQQQSLPSAGMITVGARQDAQAKRDAPDEKNHTNNAAVGTEASSNAASAREKRYWYISILPLGSQRGDVNDIDLYRVRADESSKVPPSHGWTDLRAPRYRRNRRRSRRQGEEECLVVRVVGDRDTVRGEQEEANQASESLERRSRKRSRTTNERSNSQDMTNNQPASDTRGQANPSVAAARGGESDHGLSSESSVSSPDDDDEEVDASSNFDSDDDYGDDYYHYHLHHPHLDAGDEYFSDGDSFSDEDNEHNEDFDYYDYGDDSNDNSSVSSSSVSSHEDQERQRRQRQRSQNSSQANTETDASARAPARLRPHGGPTTG